MRDDKTELFEELYRRYYNMTYHYVLPKVSDPWTAEDIVSDVFIKLYKHREEIIDVNKSSSWIITIAHNLVIDYYRKKKIKFESEDNLEFEAFYESGYDNIIIRDEFSYVTDSLPIDMIKILTMRFCENLKFREIADLMNVTESSAKRKVYDGLKIARELTSLRYQQV